MDLRRVRIWEWLAGLSGAALVVILFLPWYGLKGTSATANAWESFAVNDAILFTAALFAVGLLAAAATQRTAALPVALAALTSLVALIAIVLVAVRLISTPDVAGTSASVTREYGAWLGLAAVLGILVGAWRSMSDERTPRAVAPEIEATPLRAPRPEAGEGT